MPTLDEELDTLMCVPDDVIRSEVSLAYSGEVPGFLQPFMREPSHSKPQLLTLIKEFWHAYYSFNCFLA